LAQALSTFISNMVARKTRQDSPAPKASTNAVASASVPAPSTSGQATTPIISEAAPKAEAINAAEPRYAHGSPFGTVLTVVAIVFAACCVDVGWGARGLTVKIVSRYDIVVFRSIFETWSHEREFLLFDLCMLGLSALCLRHALRKTQDLAVYLSVFVGGCAIDLIIRKIPQLSSFWQGQNWMELLDYSEPAYILFGMYFVFQYPAIQLARNLKMDWLSESAAAALLGTLIYHPYDIVGAKYVWWLWHRDDPLMTPAEFGVPVSSTFWTMAYTGALAASFRIYTRSDSAPFSGNPWCAAALVGPVAALGLMQVPFTVFYHPMIEGLGIDDLTTLHLFRALCVVLVLRGLVSRTAQRKVRMENILLLVVPLVCFCVLALVVCTFPPEQVQRHGLFQTFGDCKVREDAYFGWKQRSKFMCAEKGGRNAVLWDFRCAKQPKEGATWYTVCPLPFPPGWLEVFGRYLACGVVSVIGVFFAAA